MESDGVGEVCLVATVERLWRSGSNAEGISARTGLDETWVRELVLGFEEGGER